MKQNVTICIDVELFKQFKDIKQREGLSFSAWVNGKMQEKLDMQNEYVCNILRKEYAGLIGHETNNRIMNDIVSLFLHKKIYGTDENSMYHKMMHELDNVEE